MSFVSYAQNLEDVMLWRIFKNIENGFYIDVGAHDPVIDSVTNAFYERGWRGINIEPVQQHYQSLCQARTNDVNLPVAAGAEMGLLPYYEIPGSGLSTLDSAMAAQHQKNGWTVITRRIPVVPLSWICQRHANREIHFLKIDVEGAEKQVLTGMDFQQFRPWVVLVEATLPCTQVENHAEWESLLLDAGYQYVYFDGLNRFYLPEEKTAELKPCFAAPPNFFDAYLRYSEYCLLQAKLNLEGIVKHLTQENQELIRARTIYAQEHQLIVTENEFLKNKIRLLLPDLWQNLQQRLDAASVKTASSQSADKIDQINLLTLKLQQEIARRRL